MGTPVLCKPEITTKFRNSAKIAAEAQHGLIAQVLKDILFSSRPGSTSTSSVEEAVDTAMSIG